MLKLSNFLQTRKIIFTKNGVEYMEPKIEGEIIPFVLDDERIKMIMKEIPEEDNKGDKFMYKLLPLIMSVENDIEFEEFVGLVATPRNGFENILNLATSLVTDLFERVENMGRLDDKINSIKGKHEDLFKLIELEELVEEKKEDIVQKTKVKKKRTKKVVEISESIIEDKKG